MKIAIPVDKADIQSTICVSFGRAPYFLIHDSETQSDTFIDNSAAAGSQGGAGIKAAQLVVDLGADALVTPRCGQNAADVFKGSKTKLYRSVGTDIKENIKACVSDSLEILEEIHAGHHYHGGR